MKNKIIYSVLAIFVLLIIFSVIYNYKLNNTIKVVKQEVTINNLPEEFEGFTILQITDLHSKIFGNNQEDLINLINKQKYDIIIFTGDMQNTEDNNYDIFLELIEGIDNKDEVFYIAGNNGPFVFENEGMRFFYSSSKNLKLNDTGKVFKELGIKLMDEVYEIKRGDSSLWISELISNKEFYEKTNGGYKEGDIRLAITHYPMNESYYENNTKVNKETEADELINDEDSIPIYDLVLAGHYHGGQWRVPLMGAIFISDINENGWFPSKERVSGLTAWGDYNQYVSRGLGASGKYKFMRFRLFNEPEINLITLNGDL